LYEAIIERRYTYSLKAKYGDDFAGLIFVGETIDDNIRNDAPSMIVKTLSEMTNTKIVTVNLPMFAKALVIKSLQGIIEDPSQYQIHTVDELRSQLPVLTTSSDGYPEWFNAKWLDDMLKMLKPVFDSSI
jgi:hypothetical protein